MSQRKLYVGLDIYNDITYMSVMRDGAEQPELIGFGKKADIRIPTLVNVPGANEVLEGFMGKVFRGEDIIVNDKKIDPTHIFMSFFSRTLTILRKKYPSETIASLVVTTEFDDYKYYEYMYAGLERIGIKKDRAMIVRHAQAFVQYATAQDRKYWVNSASLVDYSRGHIHYYNMKVDTFRHPSTLSVEDKNYDEFIPMFENESTSDEEKNSIFLNMVNGAIHGKIITSIYMQGNAFADGFGEEAMKEMALNKHIFKEELIYVKGACYGAREFSSEENNKFIYIDDNMILANVTTKVYTDAEEQTIVLAKAGVPWYQVDLDFDVIPDGDDKLEIDFKNVLTNQDIYKVIQLDGIQKRLDKETRINVSVKFVKKDRCIITVRDKGFGDFIPSSYRIWEEVVDI
ncbi:MAG: hypothetical protein K6G63_04010 [Eubacterium sp.]|nr:hypothetical protein [Eubacterium sp.]